MWWPLRRPSSACCASCEARAHGAPACIDYNGSPAAPGAGLPAVSTALPLEWPGFLPCLTTCEPIP